MSERQKSTGPLHRVQERAVRETETKSQRKIRREENQKIQREGITRDK